MKTWNVLFLGASLALVPAAASAYQVATDAVASAGMAVKRGAMLFTADGKRIGRVEMVRSDNGVPATAGVIYNGRMIYVPLASLTASDRGFVSSYAMKDLRKL